MKPTCNQTNEAAQQRHPLPRFYEIPTATQGGQKPRSVSSRHAGRVWRCAVIFLLAIATVTMLAGCLTVSGELSWVRDGKTVSLSNRGLGLGVERDGQRADALLSLPKQSEGFAK